MRQILHLLGGFIVGDPPSSGPNEPTVVEDEERSTKDVLIKVRWEGKNAGTVTLRTAIGDAELYAGGVPHPENEPAAHEHMTREDEVVIRVDLAQGAQSAEVWTCDLSADYVRINADYRS